MLSCPKCGSYDISGPRYIKSDYGQESLRYDCRKCGYDEDRPTKDADVNPVHGNHGAQR